MAELTNFDFDWRTAKGWLKDGERKLLFELAARLSTDALILNIGVEYGASLACLRTGNPTVRIVGVDLDISKAIQTYGCELVQVDSHVLVKEWAETIDLLFVDGDHGREGVLLDAQFADFLPVGGHVLFQDCWDWDKPGQVHEVCPGVNAAVDEWFSTNGYGKWFEELPSVDTTRVFRKVADYARERVTNSGSVDPDLRAAGNSNGNNQTAAKKSKVRRQS